MKPAARIGDMHVCPMVTPGVPPIPHVGGPVSVGCPTVLIGMMPAARMGDMCVCVGPPDTIAMGSPTVLIGGMMAARMGDPTMHGGSIVVGCPTVLIGESGGGGAGGGGGGAGKSSGGKGASSKFKAPKSKGDQKGVAGKGTSSKWSNAVEKVTNQVKWVGGILTAMASRAVTKTTDVYNAARKNAQDANAEAAETKFELNSELEVENTPVASDATIGLNVELEESKKYHWLKFGDDDNALSVGYAKKTFKTGASYDAVNETTEWSPITLEGEAAAIHGESSTKWLKNLIEIEVEGDVAAVSAALTPLKVEMGTGTFLAKGEVGAEAVAVQGSFESKVNITPKTIYDNTIGRVVSFVSPGSKFAEATKWLDVGVVVGGSLEVGKGAALKAGYEIGVKDGDFVAEPEFKVGLGPMVGVKAIVGLKLPSFASKK